MYFIYFPKYSKATFWYGYHDGYTDLYQSHYSWYPYPFIKKKQPKRPHYFIYHWKNQNKDELKRWLENTIKDNDERSKTL